VGPLVISGVVPSLALKAELGPPRTECGVGALMAWADRLWAVSYVSSAGKSGVGTGLYEIDENLVGRKRPESRVGTYTNRFVHFPSNQLIIGRMSLTRSGRCGPSRRWCRCGCVRS